MTTPDPRVRFDSNEAIPYSSAGIELPVGLAGELRIWARSAMLALALMVLVPLSGWLALRFGVVRWYGVALLGFGLFSLLCGVAQTLDARLADEVQAGAHQLSAVCREVTVPHLEGLQCPAVTPKTGRCNVFQQRRALLDNLLVVRPDRGDPWPLQGGQLVEIPSPLAGIPTHQRQILGGEQHRPQHSEYLAGTSHG